MGADELLSGLNNYVTKLDGLAKTVTALPESGKSMVSELIKLPMDRINPILEK